MEGGAADEEIIHCGEVADQDCSSRGAQREQREEEETPFCGRIEVGRRPAVSRHQCKEQRPGFPCTIIALPFPQLTGW